MAVGGLDGSVVILGESTTEVVVPPQTVDNDDDDHVIFGITGDGEGNVYFSRFHHCLIHKVTPLGDVSVAAGVVDDSDDDGERSHAAHSSRNYLCGVTADGNAANESRLLYPGGLQLDDSSGQLYFSDAAGLLIRRFSLGGQSDAVLHTVAGNADALSPGFGGDGGPAVLATLSGARYFWLAPSGDVFIADTLNHRVRVVDAATGRISSLTQAVELPYGIAGDAASGAVFTSSAAPRFFVDRTSTSTGATSAFAGTGAPPTMGQVYGRYSTAVAVSNASVLFFDAGLGLVVAQEDVGNVLLVAAVDEAVPSAAPSLSPSLSPSAGPSSAAPSAVPTASPTVAPSAVPSAAPSWTPTAAPTTTSAPSRPPTVAPTGSRASAVPTASARPSAKPTASPTAAPTRQTLPVASFDARFALRLPLSAQTSSLQANQTLNFTSTEQLVVVQATARSLSVSESLVRFVRAKVLSVTSRRRLQTTQAAAVQAEVVTRLVLPLVDFPTAGGNASRLVQAMTQSLQAAVATGNFSSALTAAALSQGLNSSASLVLTGSFESVSVSDVTVAAAAPADATDGRSAAQRFWRSMRRVAIGDGSAWRIAVLVVVVAAVALACGSCAYMCVLEVRAARSERAEMRTTLVVVDDELGGAVDDAGVAKRAPNGARGSRTAAGVASGEHFDLFDIYPDADPLRSPSQRRAQSFNFGASAVSQAASPPRTGSFLAARPSAPPSMYRSPSASLAPMSTSSRRGNAPSQLVLREELSSAL